MKRYVDNNHKDVNFNKGDWVMVWLCPHRQSIVLGHRSAYLKLAKRYYGLHQIMERIGKTAYKLQLSVGARIHLVFHCSLLKPFHHSSVETCPLLPPPTTIIENQPTLTPLVILRTHWDSTSIELKLKVLMQWEGLSPYDTSWED